MGDLQLYTILAMTLGWSIGGGLLGWYRHWKANRREITLAPDGRGGFQDSLIRKERVFWWCYGLGIAAFLIVGISVFNGYIGN